MENKPKKKIRYGMTRNEIADALLVNIHVLRRLLRDCGIDHGYKLNPKEIEKIRVEWGVELLEE